MKKSITLLASLFLTLTLLAQDNQEGKVWYEEVMKLEIKLDGDAAQFAHALPKERKSQKELLFTPDASLYHNNKDAENAEDVAMQQGDMAVQIKMMEPDEKFFIDLKKNKSIEKKEFMTRNFLIENDIEASGWKLTGQQKSILDYPCQQAVKTDEEGKETIAWFTPAIPVSSGPSSFVGLPGLVLEVTLKDGDHTIKAKKVELVSVDQKDLVKPKKGKKVSQEEYDQIVEEKMKEMGAERGEGGGTFIMKIER